jgi:hypothetical protein
MRRISLILDLEKALDRGILYPLLFNLVIDLFTRMLMKAIRKGYISGLMTEAQPEGVVSLQYADDTLLFLTHDSRAANHLTWLRTYFEKLFGMRIN